MHVMYFDEEEDNWFKRLALEPRHIIYIFMEISYSGNTDA